MGASATPNRRGGKGGPVAPLSARMPTDGSHEPLAASPLAGGESASLRSTHPLSGHGHHRALGYQSYAAYLRSPHWLEVRERAMERRRWQCRGCGRRAEHVHHRRYKNIGYEKPGDLDTLCSVCHKEIHAAQRSGRFGDPGKPSTLHAATKFVLRAARKARPLARKATK
jgi:hypothetical protein